jgi:AP-3 complex subunit delta
VVHLFRPSVSDDRNNLWNREIAEPQKLLPHLLQPNVTFLAPETIGAYLQAAVKLFGSWSMELSQDWDSGRIQNVREVVDTLISRLENFTSHSEIEVQERVRLIDAVF